DAGAVGDSATEAGEVGLHALNRILERHHVERRAELSVEEHREGLRTERVAEEGGGRDVVMARVDADLTRALGAGRVEVAHVEMEAAVEEFVLRSEQAAELPRRVESAGEVRLRE